MTNSYIDDVIWVERAQWEHDQFVKAMRDRGIKVFYHLDLLAEALEASEQARKGVISNGRVGIHRWLVFGG